MRLASFHVTEFQSVLDSGPVTIGEITCLVGKNESGKTALLQALYRLNPIRESDKDYSITDGYPRLEVSDYEDAVSRGERAPAVVVKAQFELSDDDINAVASELG